MSNNVIFCMCSLIYVNVTDINLILMNSLMCIKLMRGDVPDCPPYSEILTEGVTTLVLGSKATLHFHFP